MSETQCVSSFEIIREFTPYIRITLKLILSLHNLINGIIYRFIFTKR